MLKNIFIFFLIFFRAAQLQAADEKPMPCAGENYMALDFWLGEWAVRWKGGSGRNHISKSHDGCVVNEDFKSPGLHGMSISIYDRIGGGWRQTWMDNQGGFYDFYGHHEGDKFIFQTKATSAKPEMIQRMIFKNIKSDDFIWLWQKTEDNGKTWQEQWKINYSRIK